MNLNLGIHNVTSVTTQAKCLNGQWQIKVCVRCDDGSESELTLYTLARLSVIDLPDEHVRISGGECTVDRRPAPFEPAYSAD